MIKSQGYEKLFTEVNGLGPPDPVVLKSILAMATHGQVRMIIDYYRELEQIEAKVKANIMSMSVTYTY